ncbi:MAG: MFS transporter [Anaerolineaceae bacterium]|nr:MFS transporter [Anaerolineaceae bacterium]
MKNKLIQPSRVSNYAWFILALAFLSAFGQSLNMNKIAPLIPMLMDAFKIQMSDTGLLISVYSLTGAALSLPAGFIIQRFGIKNTGLFSLAFVAVGAALGAMTNNFSILLLSRIFEGVGAATIMVLGPAMIAIWFPFTKIGTAMGIHATALPIGGFLTLTFAAKVTEKIGWTGFWWISAGLNLFIFLIFIFFLKPAPSNSLSSEDSHSDSLPSFRKAMSNKQVWFLSIAVFWFAAAFIPLVNYLPTYLTAQHGFSMLKAGFVTGLTGLITVFIAPLAGWLSDQIGSRKIIFLVGFFLLLITYPFLFLAKGSMVIILVILIGAANAIAPTILFAAAPESMSSKKLSGVGIGIVSLGMNLGIMLSTPVYGGLIQRVGWVNTGYIYILAIALGILFSFLYKKPQHR